MTKYREGDVVLVEAVVRHDFDPTIADAFGDGRGPRVFMRVNYSDFAAPASEVRLLRPFFKAGERVIYNGPESFNKERRGEIHAVNGDFAWVMIDGETSPWTVPVKSLEVDNLPLEETKLPPPATPET